MAQELLYTSAPRGLKSGSRGFCTVEATSGMSPALVTVLEGLSGYRHVATPGDPANPVVYSHVTLSIGGRRCSVVSRVADAGADYTGRTNKLAHHLALDAAERPKGGPAWLAGQPNVLRTRFDGEPRTLPPRTAPQGDRPPAVCKAWQAATGDAGWAGVLAEAFLADPKRPAYLVVPAGLDLLPLFEEAIALLPPDRRWDATFTTCYTSLPQNVTCLWKTVLAGSKEAHDSRRFVQALRIDLTQSLGPATGGSLVEAARTGRMPAVTPPATPRQTPAAAVIARPTGSATALDDAPLDVMPAAPQRRPDQFLIEPLERPPALQRRSRWKSVMWTGAAVLCLAVIVSPVVLVVKQYSRGATAEPQEVGVSSEANTDNKAKPTASISSDAEKSSALDNVLHDDQTDSSGPIGHARYQLQSPDIPIERHRITNVTIVPVEAPRPPHNAIAIAGQLPPRGSTGNDHPDPPAMPAKGTDAAQPSSTGKKAFILHHGSVQEHDGLLYVISPTLRIQESQATIDYWKTQQGSSVVVVRADNALRFQGPDPSLGKKYIDYGTVAIANDNQNRLFVAPANSRYKRVFTDDLLWNPYVVRMGNTVNAIVLWDPPPTPGEVNVHEQKVSLPLPKSLGRPPLRVSMNMEIPLADAKAKPNATTTIEFHQSSDEGSISLKSEALDSLIESLVVDYRASELAANVSPEEKARQINDYRTAIKDKLSKSPPILQVSFTEKVLIDINPNIILACLSEDVQAIGAAMKQRKLVTTAFRLGMITQPTNNYKNIIRTPVSKAADAFAPNVVVEINKTLDRLDAINSWAEAIRNAKVVEALVTYQVFDADGNAHDIEVFRFPAVK